MGEPTPNRSADLNDLVAECLARHESHGPSAIDEMCKEHPQHASALRRRIAALAEAGLLDDPDAAPEDGKIPERLGEFRLLERLGAGGMGVVYLAMQESLQRVVALKLIRPENLYFPRARERFRREVESVARLHHPGIVQVHVVGEENGIPFFAMEPVHGATLAEVIHAVAGREPRTLTGHDLEQAVVDIVASRGPAPGASPAEPAKSSKTSDASSRLFGGSWVAASIRIIREVALALEHAHERGVLHRDLKPSNVMVTPDGRVLLFDFGLAAGEGMSRITRSGIRLGSLAYMSPEQFDDASAADERSDVYSLGATLYEMFTLRVPFDASRAEELRHDVRTAQPKSPRTFNPAVPSDAEVVCQVAIEKDPTRRYPSAVAFAADLANLIDSRPITARPPGVALRVRRFVRRHPTGSVALALAALLVFGVPTLFFVQERAANRRITAEAENSRHERDRAEANLAKAVGAVDSMVHRVASDTLRHIPGTETVRRALLEDARDWYQSLLDGNPGNVRVAIETAFAYRTLGMVCQEIGDVDASFGSFEKAIEIGEGVLESIGANSPTPWFELADCYAARASFYSIKGESAKARADAEHALELNRRGAKLAPGDIWSRRGLAGSLSGIAMLDAGSGNVDDAVAKMRESIDLLESVVRDEPTDDNRRKLALVANNLAQILKGANRAADSLPLFQRAIDLQREVLKNDPTAVLNRRELFGSMSNLAGVYLQIGRYDDAAKLLTESIAQLDDMVAKAPSDPLAKKALATSVTALGSVYMRQKRFDESEATFTRALALSDELAAANPAVPEYATDAAISHANHGALQQLRDRPDLAVKEFEKSLDWMDKALELAPDRADWASMRGTIDNERVKNQRRLTGQ